MFLQGNEKTKALNQVETSRQPSVNQEDGPQQEPDHRTAASRTVKNECLLFKPLSQWCSVMSTQTEQENHYPLNSLRPTLFTLFFWIPI